MLNALDVAKYLLSLTDSEKGQVISNLALQKLLYYCQGYYFAFTGKRLFVENIVAWKYGPVVESVYHTYKSNDDHGIKKESLAKTFLKKFSESEIFVMNTVFEAFKNCSAIGLMNMTHQEYPWKNTKLRSTITFDKISCFFKDKLDIFCQEANFEDFNNETKKVIGDTEKNLNALRKYDSAESMLASMGIKNF